MIERAPVGARGDAGTSSVVGGRRGGTRRCRRQNPGVRATHLCHIVRNYDSLDDIMIFSQADPFDLITPYVNTTEQMAEVALQVPADDVTPFNPNLWHNVADWDKINWTDPKEGIWITASQIASLKLAPYTPGEFWKLVLGSCGATRKYDCVALWRHVKLASKVGLRGRRAQFCDSAYP